MSTYKTNGNSRTNYPLSIHMNIYLTARVRLNFSILSLLVVGVCARRSAVCIGVVLPRNTFYRSRSETKVVVVCTGSGARRCGFLHCRIAAFTITEISESRNREAHYFIGAG